MHSQLWHLIFCNHKGDDWRNKLRFYHGLQESCSCTEGAFYPRRFQNHSGIPYQAFRDIGIPEQRNHHRLRLDKLISENVQAEKPDVMLGVISGALHIGDFQIQDCFQTFQASLERGQILPANSLKNHVDAEFISEVIKYNVKVSCVYEMVIHW